MCWTAIMIHWQLLNDKFNAYYKIILLFLICNNVFKIYFVYSVTERTAKTCRALHADTDSVIGYSVRFSSVRPGKCRGSASDYATTASFKTFHIIMYS